MISLRDLRGLDSLSKTASTVAPILFRASPIDPALRSPTSPDSSSRDLASYSTSLPADGRETRQLPSASELAHSHGNSDSTPPSTTLPPLDSRQENLGRNPGTTSLPGLSALASVATAPTSDLRYVRHAQLGMQRLPFVYLSIIPLVPDNVCCCLNSQAATPRPISL